MSDEKIRITNEDLKDIQVTGNQWSSTPAPTTAPDFSAPRQWGSISNEIPLVGDMAASASPANFFLKSWVYLGLAGLLGAFLAWAICEPGFVDSEASPRWGNFLLFPLVITAICVGFAVAESTVERSLQKGLLRGFLALILGLVLGFFFSLIANVIYGLGVDLIVERGGEEVVNNPAMWLVRGIGWMVFGVTGGIVYGIAGLSGKKCLYGALGGMLGAGIGGFLFDPIDMLTGGAGPSRCVGLMILGVCTGVAIGLVESALKNRWIYVSGGPLAGKQFILYKQITRLGSEQANDIYLFKDASIAPVHATIELRGPIAILVASAPTFVGGQPVSQRVLRTGDLIQIGRYAFQYQEKSNKA